MEFTKDKLAKAKSTLVVVKAKTLPHGQFEAILSTDGLDRHGEHVDQKGLTIPKDQVIKMYYNHETNGTALPIGKWNKLWKSSDGKLMGHGEVDLDDPFAVMVYSKILKGYIDSISIGFFPNEFDGDTSTWTKSTLVEASVVAEPANIEARITSKDLGFTAEEFKQSLKVKLATAKADEDSPFIGTPGTPPKKSLNLKKLSTDKLTMIKALISKGGVADVLNQADKWEEMEDFYEVINAFTEAYYDIDTPSGDFNSLLTECISILQTIVDGTYAFEDEDEGPENEASSASGASDMPEIKAAIKTLKSSVGALEAAAKASSENPAIKSLIKVRLAQKAVDKTNEDLGKVLRLKLKEI